MMVGLVALWTATGQLGFIWQSLSKEAMIFLKVGFVFGLLLLVLSGLGAGWVARWLFGIVLGGVLVLGAVLLLAAIL
jgi:hypothetical protein